MQEALEYLNVSDKPQKFIDCTFGGGGHSTQILKKNSRARVLGIDLDPSVDFQSDRLVLVHGNYSDIYKIAAKNDFLRSSGVLMDLGFSSYQIDEAARGFSFQKSGPLDMRYDTAAKLTAHEVVNKYPEEKLRKIIKEYGEEKFDFRIASEIARQRSIGPIENTQVLLAVITKALPAPYKHKAADSARRVFQALRIEVNSELENLTKALPEVLRVLGAQGRLVIITFHSLEDRIVKKFFVDSAKDCVCPPEFPTCICKKASKLRILTRKPVTASEEESATNPRSKSAKLRAVEIIN